MPQTWECASDSAPYLIGVQFIHQQLYTNSHWYSIIGVHTNINAVKQDVVSNLGKHIRILHRKHKLTQEELAGRSHISLKYVQNLEGKTPQNPSLVILQKLADGFRSPLEAAQV